MDVQDFFCTMFNRAVSDGIFINTGTTLVHFLNTIIEAGGSGFAGNGFNLVGGQITIDGFHSEGVAFPINVNLQTSTHSATVMHATGGANCTNLVTLQGTNTVGNFAIYDAVKQGACTNLVKDGQSGGVNRTADARPKDSWVVFNP